MDVVLCAWKDTSLQPPKRSGRVSRDGTATSTSDHGTWIARTVGPHVE